MKRLHLVLSAFALLVQVLVAAAEPAGFQTLPIGAAAPDHCFEHLTELEGCPEYTLYTINGAAVFRDWVNAIALQWLAHAGKFA